MKTMEIKNAFFFAIVFSHSRCVYSGLNFHDSREHFHWNNAKKINNNECCFLNFDRDSNTCSLLITWTRFGTRIKTHTFQNKHASKLKRTGLITLSMFKIATGHTLRAATDQIKTEIRITCLKTARFKIWSLEKLWF